MKTIISYAQNREDIVLHAFFYDIKKGFYIDVGAYHPLIDSVTKYFYEMGWTGIDVEPQNDFAQLLKKDRPNNIVITAGVGSQKGKATLYRYEGGGFSTLSEKIKKEHSSEGISVQEEVKVDIITLNDLWTNYKIPKNPEFLKIDVEGHELEVIKGNNWKEQRPKLLCIESNHVNNLPLEEFLKNQGYSKAFFDGLNDYFLADEEKNRLQRFKIDYPKRFLSRQKILSFDDYNSLTYYKSTLEKTAAEVVILKKELKSTYGKIKQLEKNTSILLLEKDDKRKRLEEALAENKILKTIIENKHIAHRIKISLRNPLKKLKKVKQ